MDYPDQKNDSRPGTLAVATGIRNKLVPAQAMTSPVPYLLAPTAPDKSGSAAARSRRSRARRRSARSRKKVATEPLAVPIYNAVYLVPRGELRRELRRYAACGERGHRQWPDALLKRCVRPPGIGDRSIPGQWEGDLIEGPGGSAIGTLVERLTGFTVLVRIDRDAFSLTEEAFGLETAKSLTYRQALTGNTGLNVYFADPRSSWQKPGNEDTGKLLRKRLPSIEDMVEFSQEQLDDLAHSFNTKPRKRHGYCTPLQVYSELLCSG